MRLASRLGAGRTRPVAGWAGDAPAGLMMGPRRSLSWWRAGRPVTDPVREGLEPEARADLRPAQPESAARHARIRNQGRIAAAIVVAWVLILGIVVGSGELPRC